jgi:lysyl-tRNA synthetase class 2
MSQDDRVPDGGDTDSAPDETTGLADHPLTAGLLEKHEAHLRSGGYPYAFDRTTNAAALHVEYDSLEAGEETDVEVRIAGRLMNLRRMGRLSFGVLQDGEAAIQLFVDSKTLGSTGFAQFDDLDAGDWVGITGNVMKTKKGELSVRVRYHELLAKALRPLPDKWHGVRDIETRSRRRYVDLMVNQDARTTAYARSRIVSELRRQFESRGYLEVETPVLLNQATGALARPFLTHHNALGIDMNLRIATELFLKRLIVGGMDRVFEIGRIFRNEGVDATHNPEFTMLESYEAYADYTDIAAMVEHMVAAVTEAAAGSTTITYQGTPLDLAPPYRRVRMVDLVAEATGEGISFDDPIGSVREFAAKFGVEAQEHWGHGKIIDELFERLVADDIWEPTFVTDHPVETSPLARRHREDPNLTERWELFIAGAEYANAFSELNDPLDQRRRFEAQAEAKAGGDEEAHPIDEDFLLALEYGMPPTGGLGIGVDRLVMLLTDQPHIREVILFPTLRPE